MKIGGSGSSTVPKAKHLQLGRTYTASGSQWTASTLEHCQMVMGGRHGVSGDPEAELIHDDSNPRCKLLITGLNNDGIKEDSGVYQIFCEDENGVIDFYIQKTGAGVTDSKTFVGGNLEVSKNVTASGTGNVLVLPTSDPGVAGAAYSNSGRVAVSGAASQNRELINFTGKSESDYASLLTGKGGVANQLFNGEYVSIVSEVTATAGRVMSFSDGKVGDELKATLCNGNVGEQNAESQVVGVLLNDVAAGGVARIATKGICSVLCGGTTTAQRGCLVTVGGGASSWQGRVTCTSRTSNEPSIGVCMSAGSKREDEPIVVLLQSSFESY